MTSFLVNMAKNAATNAVSEGMKGMATGKSAMSNNIQSAIGKGMSMGNSAMSKGMPNLKEMALNNGIKGMDMDTSNRIQSAMGNNDAPNIQSAPPAEDPELPSKVADEITKGVVGNDENDLVIAVEDKVKQRLLGNPDFIDEVMRKASEAKEKEKENQGFTGGRRKKNKTKKKKRKRKTKRKTVRRRK